MLLKDYKVIGYIECI